MWNTIYHRRINYKSTTIVFLSILLALRIRYLSLLPSKTKGPIIMVNLITETEITESTTTSIRTINSKVPKSRNASSVKYNILIWTAGLSPFKCLRSGGQDIFLTNNCKYSKCYITYNRDYLENITQFNAILFSIVSLKDLKLKFPEHRSSRQKYVVVSGEPFLRISVANPYVDGYFNWTWTGRVKSDIVWRSFRIYDVNGTEIGQTDDKKWISNYGQANEDLQDILMQKTKMAAWIVPDCAEKYKLDTYTLNLNKSLVKFGFQVDTYGKPCGKDCGTTKKCQKLVEKDYCFYLALETLFDEGYVSDALLTAFNNYAIPIVFTGDYTYERFLPPGSYIDASNKNFGSLAREMKRIMENFTLHQEYFRWRNHYFYEPVSCGAQVCDLCEALHTKGKMETVYKEFRTWWNGKPVQNVRDMLLSIFLTEPEMLKFIVGRNYRGLEREFEKQYIPKASAVALPIKIFEPVAFNFSTTDSNTGTDFMSDPQVTTALVDDD